METAELRKQLLACLDDYLGQTGEAALSRAYELGRQALAQKLGVLELAALQQQTLLEVLARDRAPEEFRRMVEAAQTIFAECLSPFEMTHRAYEEANTALRRLNELLEEEIKRIAHLLHGEAGQLLAAAHIALEEVAGVLAPAEKKRLLEIRGLLDEMENQLRRLSHELHPTILDDLGLVPALEFLSEGFSRRAKVKVSVEGLAGERFPPNVENAVYRIVQEALNNVARHARASRVSVQVLRDVALLRCVVRDDGVGFDVSATMGRRGVRGLGLAGIRERLNPLGGSLQISSAPGKGTEVSMAIPLEN
jgi:signal transduction histidine kinase